MANRLPRLRNFDYVGFHRYHVRISTWGQVHHFANPAITCAVRSQMLHMAGPEGMVIRAYCYMPNHVHVLAHGTCPTADLRSFVRRWKQRSAYRIAETHHVRLWRTGYFDRILREHEGDASVARYILENPVRAGLARNVGEYLFAWCVWGMDDLYG